MSSHLARVVIALIGIPIFAACILYGDWWFFGLVVGIALLGVRETNNLLLHKGAHAQGPASLALVFGICLLIQLHAWNWIPAFLLAGLVVVLTTELFRTGGSANLNVSGTFWSVVYSGLPLSAMLVLRNMAFSKDIFGIQIICLIFASIWACDTLAYYAGRWMGRRKLFERVSPKKTWEGAVGGLLGALGGVTLIRYLFLIADTEFGLTLSQTLVIGMLGGTLGQIGDLAESWLKRDAGVKDSSSLLPGHGGVMDRFDSLFFVAPATYVYVTHFL